MWNWRLRQIKGTVSRSCSGHFLRQHDERWGSVGDRRTHLSFQLAIPERRSNIYPWQQSTRAFFDLIQPSAPFPQEWVWETLSHQLMQLSLSFLLVNSRRINIYMPFGLGVLVPWLHPTLVILWVSLERNRVLLWWYHPTEIDKVTTLPGPGQGRSPEERAERRERSREGDDCMNTSRRPHLLRFHALASIVS